MTQKDKALDFIKLHGQNGTFTGHQWSNGTNAEEKALFWLEVLKLSKHSSITIVNAEDTKCFVLNEGTIKECDFFTPPMEMSEEEALNDIRNAILDLGDRQSLIVWDKIY